jgi:hypothetical protein
MALFGLFGRKSPDPTETGTDGRAEQRAARKAAAANRAQVDAFLRYLEAQTSVSYGGANVAQREDHQEDARYIVGFYREHLAKHGRQARAASLAELLGMVSPDHEGWGLDRDRVQYWISDYEYTQRSAGPRRRR